LAVIKYLKAERDRLLAEQQADTDKATATATTTKTNKDAIAGSDFVDDLAKRGKSVRPLQNQA
jgi:hypothetical protein